jgi:hypothetical protein
MPTEPTLLRFSMPIELQAAKEAAGDQAAKRPSFEMVAYTGDPMNAGGFYAPVVVELSGVKTANPSIPILLDHDPSQIIGQGSASVDGESINVSGEVMGDSPESKKVVALAKDGFKWQASIGANIVRREFLDAGKKAKVNGREVTGPLIIARESMLQEVSFVAIGADQKTSAAVAASNSSGKGTHVDPIFKTWLEANGYSNLENFTPQQLKPLEAAWKAETTPVPRAQTDVDTVIAKARADNDRKQKIADITARFMEDNPGLCNSDTIIKIEALARVAEDSKWESDKYHYELLKATQPQAHVFRPSILNGGSRLSNRVIEAAVCMAGRLPDHEKLFDDQTLQAAHDEFRDGIGPRQLILLFARANGFRDNGSSNVTIDAQRAAFGMTAPNRIQAAGFSNLSISSTLSNVANKFLMRGWNAVDMTPMRISKIRPVRDFKQITTVSLTGDLIFQQIGPTGEIKHGTLGEVVYNNQANTYARMLAITRTDIINDDLSALTDVPMKLGRGAALKLNDVFWTAFLAGIGGGTFFAAGHSNVNTAVADMTVGGLAATETIFLNQTDPDSNPLGIQAAIILVPTALKASASTLMTSERLITGNTSTQGDGNIWKDRFRVESSPYMSNSAYTGYSASAWYMLADPEVLPVVEIAALNGRVEPIVETADAEFNVLGIQMRGFSDIGVALQEYRAAVYADGGSS